MGRNEKTWETTKEPNGLRNSASGRYYARYTIARKQKWINLKTTKFSVAVLRNADEKKRHLAIVQARENAGGGTATMGELMAIEEGRIAAKPSALATKRRSLMSVRFLRKTWPELEKMIPERIDRDMVAAWRERVAKVGSGFVSPFARTATQSTASERPRQPSTRP